MQSLQVTTLSLETIELFRSSLYEQGRSSHTIKGYTTDLRIFLTEAEMTEVPLTEIGSTAAYWLTQSKKTCQPKTTSRRLTSLRAFLAWAGEPQILARYKGPVAGPPKAHPLPEGMAGVYRLIENCFQYRHKALVAQCGLLGMRVGEATNSKPSDFDTREMLLTVRGKGDKTRVLPIDRKAWEYLAIPVLQAQLDNNRLVVGLPDRYARSLITKLGVRADLQRPISSHDLRSTFATHVYHETKDIRVVQMLLGHSDSKTTEGYIDRDMQIMREAMATV
jgi:site-specific recombinase XerD